MRRMELKTWTPIKAMGIGEEHKELKKATCPYCGKSLEINILTMYFWSIRAACKACGNEIDFGYKAPDRTPKRVKCLACGKEFWNTELVTGSQGAHCPFCGKHKWEFVKQ